MGLAGNSATFMRKAKRGLHHFLALVLAVSTLSAISVISPQVAAADTAGTGNCVQTFTPTGAGQVLVTESGGYCYAAFKNTGAVNSQTTFAWTRPGNLTSADVLVVGGGGGGGARHAGGGGAGGYVEATAYALTTATVTIVVGAGGEAATGGSDFKGLSGKTSAFYNPSNSAYGLTALGGGYGSYDEAASAGGSGGGSGWNQSFGTVTSQAQTTLANASLTGISFGNQGRSGANEGDASDYWAGGGGGGAGARGENPKRISTNAELTSFPNGIATDARGGAGGIGKAPSWLPTSVATSLSVGQISGSDVYFAGGGGGGMGNDGFDGGAGGLGGGGNGTKAQKTGGIPGTAFTGGGGGSSGFDDINVNTAVDLSNPPGGAGGSGVVVLRYQIQPAAPTITGITGGNNSLSVAFTAPTGGSTVTGYKFSTDGGSTWSSSTGSTTSPISITGLTNGTSYQVQIRAVNTYWDGVATSSTTAVAGTTCSPTSTSASGYTTLTFTSSSTCIWSVPAGVTKADVLVVGGGGAGGAGIGGGGGAGQVFENLNVTVTGSISVTVGAGGTGGNGVGGVGANSVFGSTTAFGGGGGGFNLTAPTTASKGSGGGGGYGTSGASIVADSPGKASAGGSGNYTASNGIGCESAAAGGGGGATSAGGNGTGTAAQSVGSGGAGGAGFQSTITGLFYGGGGGGGLNGLSPCIPTTGAAGAGGNGGGGAGAPKDGSTARAGINGTAGTGGGGGGSSNGILGGNGGSGVVIVRYVNPPSISLSTSTITATVGTAVTSYAITSSGGQVSSYSISPALATNGTLAFNTTTGVISGTPTNTLSTTSYTITATNTSGTATATYSLLINHVSCSPTSNSSGGFTVVTFSSVGTCNWDVPSGVNSITYLIVGGGGAGGTNPPNNNRGPGGGGAGGLLTGSITVSAGPQTITVGNGGAGRARDSANFSNGNNGGPSSAFGLTANGGGGGGIASNGSDASRNGSAGGSGGGGGNFDGSGGSGTAGQGNRGGNQVGDFPGGGGGGGGGGAGSAGSDATGYGANANGGAGGNGVANSITGVSTFYAGGGGGAHGGAATAGAAGTGGGGRADTTSAANDAQNGENGKGGGGGASRFGTSGSGGSGVVIVRYAMATLTPTFGTPTATADGFTVQISNFNAGYTWSGTATAGGSVAVSGTGLVTVTGVAPSTSSTATITNTTVSYTGASATVSGTSAIGSALIPTFGTPTATVTGFTAQISNYSNLYTWAGTATANGTVSVSNTGLVTVTGVAANTSSTATITTARTGYTGGSATVSATSLPSCSPAANDTTTVPGYTLVKFTSTTNCRWAVPSGVTAIEVLAVGGGGGAGFGGQGGGGGGGQVLESSQRITVSPNDPIGVSVGSGGVGGWNASQDNWTFGQNGVNTVVDINGTVITALGGGGGGGGGNTPAIVRLTGANGGSGGGGAINQNAGSKVVNNFSGFNSYGFDATLRSGAGGATGGGGGAGAGGTNIATAGGTGVTIWGQSVAGGGGGWASGTGATSFGGGSAKGGITDGNYGNNGTNGTGGGGGGGANGGSGLVVIRYGTTYSITYNTNSATSGSVPASGSFTTGGSSYSIATNSGSLQRTGFTFAGWNTASDGGGTNYSVGASYSTSANLVLYAKWNSANADLSGLTVSSGTLSPVFVSTTVDYTTSVANSVATGFTVTPTTAQANATTVQYIGATGTTPFTGALSVGTNVIRTIVSAQDGTTTKTYTITVTRLATAVAPTISSQPSSVSKTAGQSVTFSVTASASDSGTLSYQWKKGGTDISGATSSSYTINSTVSGDAGNFTVVVTNTKNSTTATTTSNIAVLTMSSALTITTPTTGLSGTYNSAYSLTISASGGSGSKTFAATGSLPAGVTISSAGVISGTPSTAGDFDLTVTATDANNATATTSSFRISIAKGVSTISISAPSYTFNGSGQGPDSVTKSGSTGAVTYAFAGRLATTYSSSSTKPTAVGTYTVTATLAADSNFASVSASADFAIVASVLSAPGSLAASVVTGAASAITVTFNSVANASSYTVQLFNSGGTKIGSDYTSFTSGSKISGLTAGTSYLVKVLAKGDGISYTDSDLTSAVSVTTAASYFLSSSGGSSNYASTTNAVIPTTEDFTIEGWISPTEYNSTRSIPVIFSQGTGSNRFYVKLSSTGNLVVAQDTMSTEITCSNTAIPLNVWTHIAVVAELISGTRTLKCYVNGVLQNKSSNIPLGGATIGSGFFVGQYAASPSTASTQFAGQIDEVKVWSAARTQSQIQTNMEVAPELSAANLVAYFPFDATTGNTAIDLKNASNNLTLASTMSWLPLIRTITYSAGTNGSGTTASQTGVSDHTTAITLKSAINASGLTRSGYVISAWNTNVGGSSGNSYALSASYLGATNLDLYPTWAGNSLTITYAAGTGGTGTGPTTPISVSYGSTFTTPASTYSRSGYTFAGWNDGANTYAASATYPVSGTVTANVTLTATWTADTLTVTYNAQGGTVVVSGSVATDATLTAPTSPTRTGYTFAGWSTSSTGSVVSFSGGYAHGQTASFTLYAIWTADTLTVSYNAKGGTSVANGSVAVGASLSAPTPPTKSGSYFLGWSATDGGVTISFPYTHGQTSNFTLYAIWTAGVYSTNLRVNLDASNRNSLASGSPTVWNSIAPGSTFSSIAYRGTFSPGSTPGAFTSVADSFVSFGHQTAAEISGDITVEAWLKLNSSYTVSGTVQDIANHWFDHSTSQKDANSMDWFLRIQNGRLILFTSSVSGVETSVQSGVVISSSFADQWIQIGFTQLANGNVQFYLNGVPTGSVLSANARRGSTTARLLIGNGSSSLLGSMSKFRMYAQALTADQLKSNFNLEAATFSRLAIRTLTIDSGSYTSTYATTATGPTLTATASDGTGSKTFTSATTSVCTVNSSTGAVTFVTAGTCTISATIAADSTYDSATSASISFTVTLATRTITIDSGSFTSTYATTATAPTITSTASAGTGTKSYSSSTTSVCTIDSSTGVVTFVTAGTCTLTATIAASATHASASSSSISFTVSLATQTVSWSPTLSISATASPATPSALASALGSPTITYAIQSAGTTGCTVNSSTAVLTFTAPGSCTVRATAGATSTYAAGTADAIFTISASALSTPSTPTAVATAGTLKSIAVSWTAVTNTTSYTLKLYATDGTTLLATITGLNGTTRTITASDYSSIADNTAYKVSITAIGSGNYSSSSESSKASVTTASNYTLTYSYGGATSGNTDATASFISGGSALTLPVPAKTGYAFDGWYEASDLSGTKLSSTYTPTQSRTIYAKWIANTLVVTFDSQGGTSVTAGSVVTGANLTAPTPPTKAGYTFSGWSTTTTGSTVSFTGGYAHGQTASFTLYAIWSADALTVTYDSKSGTSVANGTVNTGASISAAPTAPTRTGYTLSGWSATDGGPVVTFPYAHGQTANFTLYAIWVGTTNTITYNSKGGSSVPNGSFVTGGNIASAPTAPTRAGYTLSGWSLTDGGAVITYPYTPTATSGITLYAIWSGISCSPTSTTTGGYTIYTFTTSGTCFWTVPNGLTDVEILAVAGGGGGGYAWDNTGAGGGAGGQVKTGTATLSTTLEVTVGGGGNAGTTSARTGGAGGNSVVGSITALGGTGGCAARSSCSTAAQASSIAAATGGAGGVGGASGRGGGGSNTTGSAPTTTTGGTGVASGYSGSSVTYGVGGAGGTARAGTTNIVGTSGSANTGNGGAGASAKSSSGDVNGGAGGTGLVVVRVASALTVTYDSQSGSSVSSGSTATGASIATAPTDPTRSNYTFLGWFTATSGGSAISFPYAHGQTADFTLYARWALNTYAIAFNANNGSGTMANQTVSHGTAANLNANLFTRANYVFHRWATAADGTGTTYNNLAQVTLTAGTTLYAQWTANTYVVTYNYNNATGGNSTATSSFTTAGTAIVLPTPTRTGFTFAGWFSDSALTSAIGLAGANYSPTGTTLSLNSYAKWTAINYTFTYDGNSADSGTVPTETSKQITQTATVSANTGSLVRTGYTFSGWNTQSNGGGTNYLSGSIFTVQSSNVTLYAKWSANTYTVTYNSNGGTGNAQRSSSNISTDDFTTGGASISLPAVGTLQKSGYTFGGWNTSAAGTGTNYSAADNYTTVSNVILYAKWNPVTFSITYNGNTSDGGSAPTIGGYTTGQASPYSVLSNTFTKTSNVFGGWNTAANGTGTSYSPGASITTLADIVLYATWIPQYTLHYAINGGSVSSGSLPADQLYNSGSSVGPVFSSVSRTGYTFGGWVNGATTVAANGNFTILADSVLTAKWNPINYTISYNSDGGTEAPASITKQIGQSYTVGAPVSKPGYNFTGWSNGSSVIGAGATVVTGSSDVTYTAQWVAKVYTISYDWNGGRGTAVSDVNYTFGTTAITLPLVGDRVKDGYTFAGWSESSNGSALSLTYTPSQSRTLYALWNIGNFTVTYDAGRGTVANSTVAVLNGGSTVLPLPTRANFVFNGWHTAVTGGSSVGSNGASFTPTASQTIYARWIQSSLYGITDSLSRIGSVVTSSNIANTFSGANSNSSVAVSIPANALPAGTTISFDLVSNSSRATGILSGVNYLVSIALSWLTGDETVPDTAADKPISVTISNSSIKAGAAAYAIVNNVSTLLGTATQDGVITVSITSDPEIVVAATKPTAPTSVAATSNGNQQSVISWSAPSSDGGSAVTGYTVTANTGASCTTSATSCTISSLTNGTAYTFTVTATNTVGTSVASTSASATTASLYAVTFDSKGGTSVTSGSFLTASTVSEPTAPTRTGYSFAGWSATDGGSAVTFPYAPGVTTAITLYARWDALDNVVTFDSKSGSAVVDGVFPSGGTVTQPTAPTRSGYTFAGWSATDGGAVVTFPYAPGVVTDITLYAKWTVVSQNSSGGSGGGSSTPAPSEPSAPANPVKSNVTLVAPVTVVGDKDAKVLTVEVFVPAAGSSTKPPAIKLDAPSEKFIADIKIVEGKLVLTPETGFSGKKTVTVTVTENGAERFIQIPLTVLPEPVTKPVLTPTASNKTIIRWTESPNADAYSVYLNGKKICLTEATSCSVNRVLGPDADIQIISNGGDRTISTKAEADFKQNTPVPITRLVSATITKGTLSRVDTKALDKVILLIKTQGFGTVVISEITTTSKTKALADARLAAIKKYIDAKTGSEKITFEVVPAVSRTYFNNISVKG